MRGVNKKPGNGGSKYCKSFSPDELFELGKSLSFQYEKNPGIIREMIRNAIAAPERSALLDQIAECHHRAAAIIKRVSASFVLKPGEDDSYSAIDPTKLEFIE